MSSLRRRGLTIAAALATAAAAVGVGLASPAASAAPSAPNRTHAEAQPVADPAWPTACTPGEIFNIVSTGGDIFELDTADAHNSVIGNFYTGLSTPHPGLNGLGVTPSLSEAFAVTQTNGAAVWTHFANGSNVRVNVTGSALGTNVTMVMGGYDPANRIYYYAGYSGTGASRVLGIWGYNPADRAPLGRVADVTGFPTTYSTGDLAFNASGTMFIVSGTNNTTTVNTSQVRSVVGVPGHSVPSPVRLDSAFVVENAAGLAGTGFYNGIAWAPDGSLWAQYATTGVAYLVRLRTEPPVGEVVSRTREEGVPSTGILTDLAGCGLPATLTLRKDLPIGRAHPDDQFEIEITPGNSAFTTGSGSGIQAQVARPVVPGATYMISEELQPGSTSVLDDYRPSWSCLSDGAHLVSGSGASGFVTIPPLLTGATRGADVVCTFTNKPAPPGIFIKKFATPRFYDHVGQVIRYTFVVRNTGGVTLSHITVHDDREGVMTTITNCRPSTLAPGGTAICRATYRITQDDLDRGSVKERRHRHRGDPESRDGEVPPR